MIQFLGAPNLISYVLLELSTLWRCKKTCHLECRGSNSTIDWASTRFVIEALKSFSASLPVFIKFFESNLRPLTGTVLRSIDSPDMPSWKFPANLLLYGYFLSCLNFLKIFLKWLLEEMIKLLNAPNPINHLLLELSIIWLWNETCDVECRGLRQRLSEYSFFLPNRCPEFVWWNWQFCINSYEVNVSPLTDTVSRSIDGPDMTSCKPIASLCLNCYF
jgi:hypothetical protein